MKYSIITFGCRVNQADSLGFEEELRSNGAVAVPAEQADVVIVNTCSVTASADQGARQTIRRVARENPAARIVVTGCYATRRPDEISQLPRVLHIVPNEDKSALVSSVGAWRLHAELSTATRFGDGDGACGAPIEPGVAGRTAFTLRVQTGCAERCSYCIIPATRGAPESIAIERVLKEVERIAARGFKEIALTGVHLGSYGRDLSPARSLVDLLRTLSGVGGVRFRISSLEPMDCTREIVDLVATTPCFAPHFHLPLQHASNRLLAAMRRPYTFEYYAALVARIRRSIPGASIGSDVIVGFPGETAAEFDELASFLAVSPLTHVHVFPYSDRPGTEAASMRDKVHGLVVRERASQVRAIASRLTARFRSAQVGAVQSALTIEDGTLAVTGNYLKVRIPPGHARNEWVKVVLTSPDTALTLA